MTSKPPTLEQQRLEALRQYEVMDTAAEQAFDNIVELASSICETPIALVTLLDERRQWFKARLGMEPSETARDISFCTHTIEGQETMVVGDAQQDERFVNNPLVLGDPNIRFYAGAPLRAKDGYALGSLCVIDRKPRQLNSHQLRALQILSEQTINLLEMRRTSQMLAVTLKEVQVLKKLLPVCAWCGLVRNEQNEWKRFDAFLSETEQIDVTHSICTNCSKNI